MKLPHLLASLPRNGTHALVRPMNDPASVYRVIRSKLKFRSNEVDGAATLQAHGKAWGLHFRDGEWAGVGVAVLSRGSITESVGDDAAEVAGGNTADLAGELVKPRSAVANPSQEIRNPLRRVWTSVSPSELDEGTRARVDGWREVMRAAESRRDGAMVERRRDAEARKAERPAVELQVARRLDPVPIAPGIR